MSDCIGHESIHFGPNCSIVQPAPSFTSCKRVIVGWYTGAPVWESYHSLHKCMYSKSADSSHVTKKHAEALLVLCLDWFFCNSNTTQQWHVSKKPSSRSVGGLYELIYRLFSFIHQLTAVACYPTQVEGWVLITSFLWNVFYGYSITDCTPKTPFSSLLLLKRVSSASKWVTESYQ